MDIVDHGNKYAQQLIDSAVANREVYAGTSREICVDCDEPIPEGRRDAIPGCQRCTDCQYIHDRRHSR